MKMEFNSDFKYDLKVGQVAEEQLAFILGCKVEVKNDLKAHVTGNIFIEYQSRGKNSGIATSEAEYYCIVINSTRFIILPKDELKKLCRKYIGTNRDVVGGDSNTSKGILLPLKDLINGDSSN
jgi:hypothetical protein